MRGRSSSTRPPQVGQCWKLSDVAEVHVPRDKHSPYLLSFVENLGILSTTKSDLLDRCHIPSLGGVVIDSGITTPPGEELYCRVKGAFIG